MNFGNIPYVYIRYSFLKIHTILNNVKHITLNRYRLSEISFVLKAVATLIMSMKKAPPAKGILLVTNFQIIHSLFP